MGKPDRATLKKEGETLKSLMAEARKKTLNFAVSQGKDGLVIETHLKKNPDMLRKLARQNGGGPKGMQGQLHADGKTLIFDVDDEPPGTFNKLLRQHFLQRGQTVNVEIRFGGQGVDVEDTEARSADAALQADQQDIGATDAAEEAPEPAEETVQDPPRFGSVYDDYPIGTDAIEGTQEWARVQDEAKDDYTPAHAGYTRRVEAARKASQPSAPIRDGIAECARHLSQAEQSARRGQYVRARDILKVKLKDLEELEALIANSDRETWIALAGEHLILLFKRLPACIGEFKTEHDALVKLHGTSMETADSGDYAKALEQIYALGAELDALDVKIKDRARRQEVLDAIAALEPGLTYAKTIFEGEEGYESLQYLRNNIMEYEAEAYRLMNAYRFDEAMAQTSYLGTEIRELDHAIAEKEAASFTPGKMPPGPLTISFEDVAKQHNIHPQALWAINPELQSLRGSPDKVEPGDPIFLPDPELNVEMFDFGDKILVIPRKKKLALERELCARIKERVDRKLASDLRTYEGIWSATSANNVGFIGSVVCIFARTDNSACDKQFYEARDAQSEFRKAADAGKLASLQRLSDIYAAKVRGFGIALNKWRDKLMGGAARAIQVSEWTRDASFMVVGTLAAGPIVATARVGVVGSMAINGLTSSAAGVANKLISAGAMEAYDLDVDWSSVTLDTLKGAAFDFLTGGAADGITKGVGFAVTGKLRGALSGGGPISHLPFGGSLTEMLQSSVKLAASKETAKFTIDDGVSLFSGWFLSDGHKAVLPAVKQYWNATATQTVNLPFKSAVTEDELNEIMADVIMNSVPEVGTHIIGEFEKSPDFQALLRD